MQKFAARDGSTARTLAVTAVPGTRRAAPLIRPSVPTSDGPRSNGLSRSSGPADSGEGENQRPTTASFHRGQVIFTPGQGVGLYYVVRSGSVRLFKALHDGRAVNLGILGPNTLFTQEESYDGLSTGVTAEAMSEATISIVDAADLSRLISRSPDLAAAVVSGMARRLTEVQTLVEQLLARDTSVRLVTTLLQLSRQFGRPTADGMTSITLPLTHQSLANMIGSNRVTVTRKLLELQERGLVRSLGRNAMAVDPSRLQRFAQAGDARDGMAT
ncbi:MAG: Crp/Fnr family transcriptional regulator [Chloroflexota bacterium]|nr:Crp/Fnr family transcriptional regulator [Chloroflexota bacterium]